VRDRLDKLPSEPHNMNTCLKRFLLKPGPSNPASSLNMAIQAVSFAVFGRRENSPAASSAAVENYGRALVKTRLAILDPNQTTSDELLHTVMLLFSYEVSNVP
jgi:hypothetical protein